MSIARDRHKERGSQAATPSSLPMADVGEARTDAHSTRNIQAPPCDSMTLGVILDFVSCAELPDHLEKAAILILSTGLNDSNERLKSNVQSAMYHLDAALND